MFILTFLKQAMLRGGKMLDISFTIKDKTLEIVQGDITLRNTDAIVNAANRYLQHGGGVALAIVRRGGEIIQIESNMIIRNQGPIPTGKAVYTTAGNLKAKYVIHVAGPDYNEYAPDAAMELLKMSINSCFDLALKLRLKSISLPAISSGIYGFPKDKCADILIHEAFNHLEKRESLKKVEFVLFDEITADIFANTAKKYFEVYKKKK